LPLQAPRTPIHRFRAPWTIFWAGFLVRVLYMTLAHTYKFRLDNEHFQFGWEMGRIARALANGYGYADPFAGHTGPTAWVPPVYPLILAGVFKIFGIYSLKSAWVILTINSVFSALTALPAWEIAARCFNLRVAKWSGWLWALYPAAMQYAVRWVWEMTLTTLLFACVLALALRMRGIGEQQAESGNRATPGRWLLFGLLWGLIALCNSTALLFLPVCGLWIVFGTPDKSAAIRGAVLSSLVFLACVAPWFWRNWQAFHAFVPLRSNLGVELWWWNNPDANGIGMGAPIEPYPKDPRFMAYARMGELPYSHHQGELAKAFIRSHPGRFAILSLKRAYFYWVSPQHPVDDKPLTEGARQLSYCFLSLTGLMGLGLALRNRIPVAGLFAWAFLLLPLTYYFVNVQARFRHPLEPLIAVFSVYLFQSAKPRHGNTAANH
jgi:Dolichyl-phosphate-mannose-protein mannosyltransferase